MAKYTFRKCWPLRRHAAMAVCGIIICGMSLPVMAQEERPRIAVLEFQAVGVSESQAAAVTDQLRKELVRLQVYTVVDRAQTVALLDELAFQQTGLTSPDEAAQVGKILNVRYIVTGRVTDLGGAYQVNAQLIQVETAAIDQNESVVYKGNIVGLLAGGIAILASRLSPASPAQSSQSEASEQTPVIVQSGKPTWPLWAGGLALMAAYASYASGEDKNDEAQVMADRAREENNAALYTEAQATEDEANNLENVALGLGGIGVGLLVYYLVSDAPGEAGNLSGQYGKPPPWNLELSRDRAMLRVTVNW